MDPAHFTAPDFGAVVREPGNKFAFWYFKPAPIPRELALVPATIKVLSDADAALGRLYGLGALIRDPELLLGPYLTQEAIASSRIEGTQTSLSEVLQAEAGGGSIASEDIAEVERYVAATRRGYELIKTRRSAEDAVHRAERLVALREKYLADAAKTRSNLSALVALMFTNPYLTTARVQQRVKVTNQGARNLIKEAEKRGWVEEYGSFGRGGRIYWLARELYSIIDAPTTYE